MKPSDVTKQQVVSITYEDIGLFPRSFNRVFDRFFKQIFSDVENLVIQEYRFYRYLFLTTIKCLFLLIFIPFLVNFMAKTYLVKPLTEYFWNTKQTEIFLNSYQQKLAFSELENYEEKIYFESLIAHSIAMNPELVEQKKKFNLTDLSLTVVNETYADSPSFLDNNSLRLESSASINPQNTCILQVENERSNSDKEILDPIDLSNIIEKCMQSKVMELALRYNDHSIEAITNCFADFLSVITLCFLVVKLEIQLNITKSFLLEVFFGLDDSKKSLFILFITDLLVGYHSPNIWEFFFQFIFYHYGLAESQTSIFLLVATLPVLLDVLFKYIIFRHLNRASPATVATYHAMIE